MNGATRERSGSRGEVNERSESTSENVLELLELFLARVIFARDNPQTHRRMSGRRPPPVVVKRVAKLGRVLCAFFWGFPLSRTEHSSKRSRHTPPVQVKVPLIIKLCNVV